MPSLDWTVFNSLPGNRSRNFEYLCRGLMQLHYGRFGQFKALSNQPGVEFHIKLTAACALGDSPKWYGWQCKCHTRKQNGDLKTSSRNEIETSLRITEQNLPELTDWILWTPYTLSKKDQDWYFGLSTKMALKLWAEEEVDTYLSGDGLILRSTYFGELVLTPHDLEQQHQNAVQPILERWLKLAHQSVDAERTVRRMLGEPGSWEHLIEVGERLEKTKETLLSGSDKIPSQLEVTVSSFASACTAFSDTLLGFHKILAQGDLDLIQQKLRERNILINREVCSVPRLLRNKNLPIALEATNALDDMRIAKELLDEVEEFLGVGLVAVLADAGGGKTQMAAQLTAPQDSRPAGILLHGRDLHKGQTMNDLAHHFSINGNPLNSIERLLASLDAAGKRECCRLPVVIDGLNEAENPKDWKATLAILNETVKKYPNVLVICTLRTGEHRRNHQQWGNQSSTNARDSFAAMSLPEEIRKIESEGFGGDVDEAIEKYFDYFKIDSGDTEIPVEFLQHPLTLRIFCQVTNPKRESEVKINYFPASLSPLFEKYIANACKRISEMPNLSYSYTIGEVESAIYRLGLELWKSNKREISESDFRTVASDSSRLWDSSIVNLLAQEGIIFRNRADEPDSFVVTPVYDALGGYIVANALLSKHSSDRKFEWLKLPDAMQAFGQNDSHELSVDIFRSLVLLTPARMNGIQLWKVAPEAYQNAALEFVTLSESKYLDGDTIAALIQLFKDCPEERERLFYRLHSTRGAVDHPLNADFLDSVLRQLTVSDRDLSWTEWLRETRVEKFNDLIANEQRWKENSNERTTADQLRAKWFMWFLTSSNRKLRDVTTRALYWFGRGDPITLFAQTINSLEINDPYVPERMLAASYGVAMALHTNFKDDKFSKTVLADYARQLYDSFFAETARNHTTHSLTREYVTRIIELAVRHNPEKFSQEEIRRSNPPFASQGQNEWGESQTSKEEHHGLDSPFRMDFENYTLGGLVPDRSNYDFRHEEYQKVRSQILWRIEGFGWTSELFRSVESSIERSRNSPFREDDPGKIDRYGKKYSWIAYHEMSGLLHDLGKLENWRERTSSVDIDPSFPEPVTTSRIIDTDFLGDPEMEMTDWITSGSLPKIEPFLRSEERINQTQGPWITLDGLISQNNETRGRRVFCFIRTFLVDNQIANSFFNHLKKQDLSGRWLPEKPEVVFTFAGEIVWSDTFPNNGMSKFSFKTGEKKIKVKQKVSEMYLDGEKLGLTNFDIHLIKMGLFGGPSWGNKESRHFKKDELERIEVREKLVEVEENKEEFAEFEAMIPVCDIRWEGDQTVAHDIGYPTTLAKEIALDLELLGQPQTFDLFEKNSAKATLNLSDRKAYPNDSQSFFFIREDLLRNFLEKNQLSLFWAVWGERQYSEKKFENFWSNSNQPNLSHGDFSFIKQYQY